MPVLNFIYDFQWFWGSICSMTVVFECQYLALVHRNDPEQGAKFQILNHFFLFDNNLSPDSTLLKFQFTSLHVLCVHRKHRDTVALINKGF